MKVNADLFEVLRIMRTDAVVVIDRQGTIVLVNREAERVFAFPRDEMLRRRIELLIPERFRRGHIGHRHNYFARPRSRPRGTTGQLSIR